MSVLFRHSSKTAMFSRFLKIAIGTSNFMDAVFNGRLIGGVLRFNVKRNHRNLMLKKIASLRLCIGNLEIKSKTRGKI